MTQSKSSLVSRRLKIDASANENLKDYAKEHGLTEDVVLYRAIGMLYENNLSHRHKENYNTEINALRAEVKRLVIEIDRMDSVEHLQDSIICKQSQQVRELQEAIGHFHISVNVGYRIDYDNLALAEKRRAKDETLQTPGRQAWFHGAVPTKTE